MVIYVEYVSVGIQNINGFSGFYYEHLSIAIIVRAGRSLSLPNLFSVSFVCHIPSKFILNAVPIVVLK